MAIYNPPTQPQPRTKDRTCTPCPACGGLECLCRPRFFAGQLLTDVDLNRLNQYILGKNRLHNRYLHGIGVVCGLEVVCHPCEGFVTVKAGYAISPCGDDIVVCADDDVNLCELINQCHVRRREVDCDVPRPQRADDCTNVEEEWVLAICYEERPSRGVMSLRSSTPSCSRCGCNGYTRGGCSCGCHEKPVPSVKQQSFRNQPAQCEPTVTCETYHFELRKAPMASTDDRRAFTQGEIVRRFAECIRDLTASIPAFPTEPTRPNVHRWCCQLKVAIQDLLARHALHDCTVDDRLDEVRCPDPAQFDSDASYLQAVLVEVSKLAVVGSEYLRACLCSALLPPCPPPADDNCINLAQVTVRRSGCKILRVCNIDHRQFAVTVPSLLYWLSVFPLGALLRQAFDRLCCAPVRREAVPVARFERRRAGAAPSFTPGVASATTGATGVDDTVGTTAPGKEFGSVFAQAWQNRNKTVSPYALFLDALGAVDAEGRPVMSDLERAFPLESIWLNQLGLPTLDAFLPEAQPRASAAAPAAELDALKAEMAELRELVRQQQSTIEALQQRGQSRRKSG